MTAPLIWVVFPSLMAFIALFLRKQRFIGVFGAGSTFLLTLAALIIPIDQAIQIGSLTFKVNTTLLILGRRLVIAASDTPLLVLIYGLISMWLLGSSVTKTAGRLVPLGLAISALAVASLAVEPFLYAAILIEIAILLAVPLLTVQGQPPGPGLLRFLIYQTLGMPFILFAGWLLAGVEASPADLALAIQSATILGLGFAFLMAVFPLYTWMPMLAEEVPPYILGFLLWILPTVTLIFGMGFLDRYAWIRTSDQLGPVLRTVGLLMLVTGGIWSAFQKHLGRLLAYGVIAETGTSLLALSLPSPDSIQLFFLLILPRSLGFLVWTFCLEGLLEQQGSLDFRSLLGIGRKYPVTVIGLLLAYFSIAGFPLLAGFPVRLALWNGLAGLSLPIAFWFLVGTLGLFTGATRSMGVMIMTSDTFGWEFQDGWDRVLLIGIGVAGLFILGMFPQLSQPLLQGLPAMFEHLGK